MKFIDIPNNERKVLLDIYASWKKDYETMQTEMIYGESATFDRMIADLSALNDRINSMQ